MRRRDNCCLAAVALAMLLAAAVYLALNTDGARVADLPAGPGRYTASSRPAAAPPGAVAVRVVSVYDGDTFTCDIDGYPDIVGRHIGVRISGIDTPELNDARPRVRRLAAEAREFAARRLDEGGRVELRDMERDKYFRILADVYVDGTSLADELVGAGLAKPYGGGARPKW